MYYKAIEKAKNNGQLFHLAAILWRNKTPVRISTNSHKTHPNYQRLYPNGDFNACLHAEMDAIRFYRPGDKLEVFRVLEDGSFAMAKPCKFCQAALLEKGITSVRYTNECGEWKIFNILEN